MDAFGDKGLGLGSQISQVMALASANRLDHVVSSLPEVFAYGRYMDDGYVIARSKEALAHVLEVMQKVCKELEIVLHPKKTHVTPIRRFTWLKIRWYLTDTGKLIKKIYRRSVTKMRQKLKAFSRMVKEGKLLMKSVREAWQSWFSYAKQFNAHRTIRSMFSLYAKLFFYPEKRVALMAA